MERAGRSDSDGGVVGVRGQLARGSSIFAAQQYNTIRCYARALRPVLSLTVRDFICKNAMQLQVNVMHKARGLVLPFPTLSSFFFFAFGEGPTGTWRSPICLQGMDGMQFEFPQMRMSFPPLLPILPVKYE